MSITLSALQKQRRDTAANWTAEDPTLLAGEIGLESDTGYWKVGDGATAWTSLAYVSGLGAEIPVDRLADGTARQLLQTDAAGTGVEWTDNVDVPGTLDVTGAATFDDDVTIQGDLTVNGTTTTIDTTTLVVEDKNIEIGKVATPTDVTADGGGITLKGDTDKTINWVDATDAWTLSEHVDIASGKEYQIAGTKVLDATSLGSAVVSSSLTSVGTIGTGVWNGTAIGTGYGGTGQTTYTDGELLIGKTDGTLAKATITQGSGVTITNGDGTITISATGSGGTVTAVTGTSPIASTGGTTPDISIQDGTTTQKGAVQLEDSTSSTSTTTAATPNSVKSAYDLANAALPKTGGTMTGDIVFSGTQTFPGTGSGTVTSVDVTGGTGLTSSGGPITSSGTITVDLDNTAVTPGSYTYASITVDQQGRLTAASNGTTPLTSSDIGVTVQGYDADTAKLDTAQTFTAAQTFASDLTLNAQSDLRFADSDSSNWVAFQAPATVASNVTWTLPDADGTSGQVLSTDGAGALSWATAAGGATDKIEEGNTSAEVIDTGSDGRFVVTTEGVEALRVDASQRVGISTTSASSKLHVNGANGDGLTVSGGGATGVMRSVAAGTEIGNTSGDNTVLLSGAGVERMRIDSSGRLLVGTSSASGNNLLQVNSNISVNGLNIGTLGGVSFGSGNFGSLTTGYGNVCIGNQTGADITSGYDNVIIGQNQAFGGWNVTTGSNNVFLGVRAGEVVTTGARNICIGYYANPSANSSDGQIVVGTHYGSTGKGNNTGFINPNGGGNYQGNNSSSWSTTSDRRIKKNIVTNNEGIEKINQIRVVNFEYRLPDEIDELPQSAAVKKKGVQLGVIAQELQQVCPECVKEESTGVLSVDSDNLTWHLINAVKQLSTEVDALKTQFQVQ